MGKKGTDVTRNSVKQEMIEWLHVLRSALNISQGELADFLGISRQTYSAIELGKKEISWSMFLAFFAFFMANEKSRILLTKRPGYVQTVYELMAVED